MSRAVQEFAQLEEQLSGVERYAMKFLEVENADVAAERLRQAEVSFTVYYTGLLYMYMYTPCMLHVYTCIYIHVYCTYMYVHVL